VQRDAQSRKRQLDKAFAQAMEQVRVELIKQVAELARELGVGAVLFQDQIVIAERKLDITETALKRVNQKLPKVKVVLQPLDK
jgi:outer membrane protein